MADATRNPGPQTADELVDEARQEFGRVRAMMERRYRREGRTPLRESDVAQVAPPSPARPAEAPHGHVSHSGSDQRRRA
jgi:hypothetical protein